MPTRVSPFAQGILVVKMFAWEGGAAKRVQVPRDGELAAVLRFVAADTGVMTVIWVASMLMGLASFTAFYLSGHDLSAEIIFPSLYLFEMLTFPLLDIPMSLATYASANTSFRRIAVRNHPLAAFCVRPCRCGDLVPRPSRHALPLLAVLLSTFLFPVCRNGSLTACVHTVAAQCARHRRTFSCRKSAARGWTSATRTAGPSPSTDLTRHHHRHHHRQHRHHHPAPVAHRLSRPCHRPYPPTPCCSPTARTWRGAKSSPQRRTKTSARNNAAPVPAAVPPGPCAVNQLALALQ